MVFARRRKQPLGLREEVLTASIKTASNGTTSTELSAAAESQLSLNDRVSNSTVKSSQSIGTVKTVKDEEIFSKPGSTMKGSFLKNRLENPLFRNLKKHKGKTKEKQTLKHRRSGSGLKVVTNAEDLNTTNTTNSTESEINLTNKSNKSKEKRRQSLKNKRLEESTENSSDSENENSSNDESEHEKETETESHENLNTTTSSNNTTETAQEDKRLETIEETEIKTSKRKTNYLNLSFKSERILNKNKSIKSVKSSTKSVKIKKERKKSTSPTVSKFIIDTVSKQYKKLRYNPIKLSLSRKTKTKKLNLKLKRQEINNSISSSDSNNSKNSHVSNSSNLSKSSSSSFESLSQSNSCSDREVDLLTKYEETVNEVKQNKDAFKLFTQKGLPVVVYFNSDYLQVGRKICFYEDLATWSHDSKCLRLIYVKNKDTPEQERAEIRLFVSDKEYAGKVMPKDLNDLLREKIAVLISDKFKVSFEEALKMTENNATDQEVEKINQQIDKSSEKNLARSYLRNIF